MVTGDIRLERLKKEYGNLPQSRDQLQELLNTLRERRLTQQIADNRELINENRKLLLENRDMLKKIIEHLKVPYKPTGFNPER